MTELIDTGFLYALLNQNERQHESVQSAFAQTTGPWLLPTPAITEVAYLLMKFSGPEALALFLENLTTSNIRVVEPSVSLSQLKKITNAEHN